jgi:hypothetical protein
MWKLEIRRAPRLLPGLFLTWTSAALAMVVPLSLAELISQSQLIVHGEVVELASERAADGPEIFTIVTVDVAKVVYSRNEEIGPERRIAFRIEGGTVGEETMATSNSPTLNEGEEAVFFLAREEGDEMLTLVGGPQGVFRIEGGKVRVAGQDRPLGDFLQEILEVVE